MVVEKIQLVVTIRIGFFLEALVSTSREVFGVGFEIWSCGGWQAVCPKVHAKPNLLEITSTPGSEISRNIPMFVKPRSRP